MHKEVTDDLPIRPSAYFARPQSVPSDPAPATVGRASTQRLGALTGLRFLAAASVVVSHTNGWFDLPAGLGSSINLGGSGVTFFFVLSGFILTYVYPRLETAGERGRFLLARFARLWPAHVLGLLAVAASLGGKLWPGNGYGEGWQLGLNLAMLHSWVPDRRVLDAYNGIVGP